MDTIMDTVMISSAETYQDESLGGTEEVQIEKRYGEERAKRLRDDGIAQFIDISLSDKFQHFLEDPWVDPTTVKDAQAMFPDNRCQMLILGAGWGGLLYAVRMIQSGIRPEDIRIIDIAGGFGGTWYYNRYPGLVCDIESYCYLPLLEETGYMPKLRYASGDEIRKYANLVAEKYGIAESAVFQTKAEKLVWNEETKEWQVKLVQARKGQPPQTLNVCSQFVATVNGVLNWPKLPNLPGILEYQGDVFHSSRWNYSITGGSSADPSLTQLKDKRVAIIGTGCSAVQIVPHLARFSKHVYVVQRTPASVDTRGQRKTDPEWFKNEVANNPGWQRERMRNFHQHFTTGKHPKVNLVNDQWTHAQGMVAVAGNPLGPKSIEELPEYLKTLHSIDLPRTNRIRDRVMEIVKDSSVAEKLQPWYPTWCKRPAFHDDYLQTFNEDNVTLLDTAGKGPDGFTKDSIVVGGDSYPVDIVIFATGFRAPYGGTPAEKANATIIGRNGISMTQEWARNGPSTLRGLNDHNFPNLFLSGPWQASLSGNNLFNVDIHAKLASYILAEARQRSNGNAFAVTPTAAAVEDWGLQILMRSAPMAAGLGCTPGYFNLEGDLDRVPPKEQMKIARSGLWGNGVEGFIENVEAWCAEGNMQGIEVQM